MYLFKWTGQNLFFHFLFIFLIGYNSCIRNECIVKSFPYIYQNLKMKTLKCKQLHLWSLKQIYLGDNGIFCEWITLFGGECCQIDSYFFLLFFWQFLRDISINKHIYQKKNIGQYIVTEYLFGWAKTNFSLCETIGNYSGLRLPENKIFECPRFYL